MCNKSCISHDKNALSDSMVIHLSTEGFVHEQMYQGIPITSSCTLFNMLHMNTTEYMAEATLGYIFTH